MSTDTEEETHGTRVPRPQRGRHPPPTTLTAYSNLPDALILAFTRGGVPAGFEIAKALQVPLDVIVVQKLSLPGQEELAMGAIATGGLRVLERSGGAAGMPKRLQPPHELAGGIDPFCGSFHQAVLL
ncbi:MAG TPA: hypothetical protein VHP35_11990 [Terriglobia bacterium]|jgi:hypothetical protein|nr:hypothetical protein [Terriglobia bacterium]